MKSILQFIVLLIFLLVGLLVTTLMSSCSQDNNGFIPAEEGNTNKSSLNVTIPAFTPADGTRSTINTDYTCSWQAGDKIGMFAHRVGAETTNASQLCFALSDGAGSNTATFTGGIGWKMSMSGMYQYVAYSPYNEINADEKISLTYNDQKQTANGSTADLGKFDFMYSELTTPSAPQQASFEMKHINALLNLELAVPEDYQDQTFTKVVLTANDKIFTDTAVFSVASLSAGTLEIQSVHKTNTLELSLGEDGQGFKVDEDGKLNVYMMMPPISLEDKEIKVELMGDYSIIVVLEGFFTGKKQESSTIYTEEIELQKSSHILPPAPLEGDTLHILLFGHSFGTDCFTYLPQITSMAGVKNVHYGRFFQGNCTMDQHYEHWLNEDTESYEYHNCSGKLNFDKYNYTSKSVIDGWPWDIIIFQTNISSKHEGNYESYKSSFKAMVNEVIARCQKKYHKTPVIGWNMFWGFNYPYKYEEDGKTPVSYNVNADEEYNSIVSATQEMMADKEKGFDVKLIIPTGTSMQNARGTSLNDNTTCQLFTRDGYHASEGIGRYVTAATWFQTIIAPIYGKTIVGNPFRPTSSSGTWDVVDDAKATILQKCAVEAAKHPFTVTHIDE